MLVHLQSDSSDSEVYEEYTWGDITRVRATSMLDARTRASEFSFSGCSGVCQLPASPLPQHLYTDLFNGTVILNEAEEENCILDVEGDSSEVYGPSQFDEGDLISLKEEKSPSKEEAELRRSDPLVKKEVKSGCSYVQGSSERHGVESGGSCGQGFSARQEAKTSPHCLVCMVRSSTRPQVYTLSNSQQLFLVWDFEDG